MTRLAATAQRRAFFAYEKTAKGPAPVVYYGELPSGSNGSRIITSHEIINGTANITAFPGADESPSFAALMKEYPLAA